MHRTTCAATLTLTLALVSACSTEDEPPEKASEAVSGRPALPDLPAAPVGLTKGEFAVDRSGAASYRLAIEVPPGRAGMQPSIGLSYDSNQGLGPAGYGWVIDGITRITRCGSVRAAHGLVRAVKTDGADNLCMNGEYLIPIAPASGALGSDLEFRLERDSLIRVLAYSNGRPRTAAAIDWDITRFVVQYPDGLMAELGATPDSRVNSWRGPARTWSINRLYDRFGNGVRYSYFKHVDLNFPPLQSEDEEQLIDRIDYTDNDGSDGAAPLTAQRSVYFTYEAQSSPQRGYAYGGRSHITQRLRRIRTVVPGTQDQTYELSYAESPATGRSLLSAVARCAGNPSPTCLPPIRFEYSGQGVTFGTPQLIDEPLSLAVDGTIPPMLADFDGDGLDDVLFVSYDASADRSTGWVRYAERTSPGTPLRFAAASQVFQRNGTSFSVRPHDLDKDGRVDLLVSRGDGTSRVYQSRGRSFFPMQTAAGALYLVPGLGPADAIVDLDGDGFDDLLSCGHSDDFADWYYRVSYGRADGTFEPELVTSSWCSTQYRTPIVDLDGDGVPEVIVGEPTAYPYRIGQLSLANRVQKWELSSGSPTQLDYDFGADIGDANGDGVPDLFYRRPTPGWDVRQLVYIHRGRDFLPLVATPAHPKDLGTLNSVWRSTNDAGSSLADFNDDGRTDFYFDFAAPSPGIRVFLTRDAMATPAQVFGPPDIGLPALPVGRWGQRALPGDFDGNGSTDLLILLINGQFAAIPQTSPKADLLTVVRESTSEPSVQVEYKPLADPTVYSATNCTNQGPTRCVFGGRSHVVSAVRFDVGSGAPRPRNYQYANARRDTQGRGWLGFERVQIDDPERSSTEVFVYDNSTRSPAGYYPFLGMLRSRTRTIQVFQQATGGREPFLETEANTLDELHPAPGTYRGVVTSTRRTEGSASCSPAPCGLSRDVRTTVVSRDALGFPTQVLVDRGDGLTELSTYDVRSELATWLLGQVRTEQVTARRSADVSTRYASTTYDRHGAVETRTTRGVSDPQRLIEEFPRDSYGNPLRHVARSALGERRQTTFEYQKPELIQPAGITNALGHVTTILSHERFGPLQITDPNGEVTDVGYDTLGRRVRQVDAAGAMTSYDLQSTGSSDPYYAFRLTIRPPGAPASTLWMDRLGRTVQEEHIGFDGSAYRSLIAFDRLGRTGLVTEPSSTPGQFIFRATAFDELDRPIAASTSSGDVELWYYQIASTGGLVGGWRATHYDPNLHPDVSQMNGQGELVSTTDALGGTTTYTYDPFGLSASVVDPRGNLTKIERDAYGLRIGMQDPTLGAQTYGYNAFGEMSGVTSPGSPSLSFKYDALGRPTSRKAATGPATTWDYDLLPGTSCPVGSALVCGRDRHSLGREVRSTSPTGQTIETTYDTAGRKAGETYFTGGKSLSYSYRYDASGRLSTMNYPKAPDGAAFGVTYRYQNGALASVERAGSGYVYWQRLAADGLGNTLGELFGNGVETRRRFEPFRGLATIDSFLGQGATIQALAFDRDRVGNLLARRDLMQGMTERFGYDALDRLTDSCFVSGTAPVLPPPPPPPPPGKPGGVIAPYYPLIQPLSGSSGSPPAPRIDPASNFAKWAAVGRSPLTRPDQVAIVGAAGPSLSPEREIVGAQTRYQACTTFSYDALGSMTQRSDLGSYNYPASTAGGRTLPMAPASVSTPAGGSVTMTYDEAGRLLTSGKATYTYDELGQLQSGRTSATARPVTYAYDPNGRRARKDSGVDVVDYAGTLFELHTLAPNAQVPTSFGATGQLAHYYLTAGGRVIADVVYHPSALTIAPGLTTLPPWTFPDGRRPTLSTEARTAVAGAPLQGSSTAFYYHDDVVGSVEVVTDAQGGVVERRSFNAFGQLRSADWRTGTTAVTYGARPSGFTGHEDDVDLGLVNMQGRVYSPALARFLTPDPIIQAPHFSQSLNRYSYVWNRPLTMVDPSGFEAEGSDNRYAVFVHGKRLPEPEQPTETGSAPRARIEEAAERMHQISERAIEFGQGMLDAHEVELRERAWSLAAIVAPFSQLYRAPEVAAALATSYKQGGVLEVVDMVNPVAGALRLYVDGDAAIECGDYQKLGSTTVHVAVLVTGMIAGFKAGPGGGIRPGGQLRIAALSQRTMLESASRPLAGGATAAGRALQKHASRAGSWLEGRAFGGNHQKNAALAAEIVEDIVLRGEVSMDKNSSLIRVRLPDGSGAAWRVDGSFFGFLERYSRR